MNCCPLICLLRPSKPLLDSNLLETQSLRLAAWTIHLVAEKKLSRMVVAKETEGLLPPPHSVKNMLIIQYSQWPILSDCCNCKTASN